MSDLGICDVHPGHHRKDSDIFAQPMKCVNWRQPDFCRHTDCDEQGICKACGARARIKLEATKRKDPAAALRSILRQLEEKRDEWLVAANLCVTTGLMDERASHRAIVYKENADVLTSLIAKYVAADSPEAKLWGERTVCFNCGHDKKFKYVPLCEDCFQELDETK